MAFQDIFTKFARGSPIAAGITGLAAITLPFAMRDENRGYLKTAALTSPFIVAAGMAMPSLVPAIGRSVREHVRFAGEAGKFILSKRGALDYISLRQFIESGEISPTIRGALANVLPGQAMNWLSQFPAAAPISLSERATSLRDLTTRMMEGDAWEQNKWLMSYAFERTRLSTLSPAAAAADPNVALAMPGAFTREELTSRLEAAISGGNERFLELLEGRLRYAGRLRDLGPQGAAMATLGAARVPTIAGAMAPIPELQGRTMMDLLRAQRLELWSELTQERHAALLSNAEIVATDLATKPKLLSVRIKMGDSMLAIPILDPTSGVVHIGSNYRIAAGRGVWGPEPGGTQRTDLDIWLAQHLEDRPLAELERVLEVAPVGSLDKLNTWKWEAREAERTATLTPEAIQRYSMQYIVDPGKVFNGKTFEDLTNAERVGYLQSILGETGWGSPIIAEHSYLSGTIGSRKLEFYTAGRMAPWRGQSEAMRAFNKPLRYEYVPGELRPYFNTALMQNEMAIRHTFAAIRPTEATLFGGLPSTVAGLATAEQSAISSLMMEGRTEAEARRIWAGLRPMLQDPRMLQAARLAGGLGETEAILRPDWATTIPTIRQRWAALDVAHVPIGESFGPNQVLGYLKGQEIVAEAPATRLMRLESDITGQMQALLEETYPSGTGDKLNVGGVKVTTIEPEGDEFEQLRNLINRKRALAGETEIPEVASAFINELFFHEKIKEPAGLLAQQGAAIYKEAEAILAESPDINLDAALETYRNRMADESIFYRAGRFEEETERLAALNYKSLVERQNRILTHSKNLATSIANYSRANQSQVLRRHGILAGFVNSPAEGDLLQYMFYNALSAGTAKWDVAYMNMPQRTILMHELYGQMYQSGLMESLRTLYGRAKYLHGNIRPVADMVDYLNAGKFTTPFGKAYSWQEAVPFNFGARGMTGRVGALDYTDPRFRDPFSIKLTRPIEVEAGTRMVKHEYIPVLGWGTYGGGPNIEGPAAIHATKYENALRNLIISSMGEGAGYGDAWEAYQKAVSGVAFGKEGAIWRATAYDPLGISAASEQIMAASPFDVLISEELAGRFGEDVQTALRTREGIYGIISRHPIQAALPVRVRLAEKHSAEVTLLGKRGIGITKQLAGGLEADFDKDTLNLHLMSPRDRPAIEELRAAIQNPESASNMYLNTINLMYANADDSAMHRMGAIRGEESAWAYLAAKNAGEVGSLETAAARLSARFIPQFSNLVTQSQIMLRSHPGLMANRAEMAFLSNVLWLPRQAAIGAIKGTQNVAEQATAVEALLTRMKGGLGAGTAGGARDYIAGLSQIAENWKWKAALTPETAATLFGVSEADLGSILEDQLKEYYSTRGMEWTGTSQALRRAVSEREHFNVVKAVVESERVRTGLETLIQHPYGQEVKNVSRFLTATPENVNIGMLQMHRRIGEVAPELQALGGARVGMRDVVSSVLGAFNREAAAGRTAVSRAFKGTLPLLGFGLGVAAVAGAMIGPRVGGRSAANYRPEIALATTDRVPGEPVAGSLAPVSPPRRVIPAAPMTRTAMVTPMQQAVDLEVRAPAGDRERAAELSRIVSQVVGGKGTVISTTNYINGHNRLSKLRTRQRVREILGED